MATWANEAEGSLTTVEFMIVSSLAARSGLIPNTQLQSVFLQTWHRLPFFLSLAMAHQGNCLKQDKDVDCLPGERDKVILRWRH